MRLPDISFGRVPTHLCQLYSGLADGLVRGVPHIRPALERLEQDSVYRFLRTFRPPVPECEAQEALKRAIEGVENAAKARCATLRSNNQQPEADQLNEEIAPVVATAHAFLDRFSSRWDSESYIIVPVYVVGSDGTENAALTYLRRFEPDGSRIALWNLAGLTSDPRLEQLNFAYFDEIANVMMGVWYGTEWQSPHSDPHQLRSDHVYKLLFECELGGGRSHGGAILTQFALSYLRSMLGKNYLNDVSPVAGMVISAEVKPDGTIRAVDHAAEMVTAALDAYGAQIHIILPLENQLSPELTRRFPREHLHYVATAEELLATALFLGDGARGLEGVRARLFQLMGRAGLEAVFAHLRPDVSRARIELRYATPGSSVSYKTHPCGVMSRAEFGRPMLGLRLGFERSPFESDVWQPDLVLLVLDASAQMDHAWTPGGHGLSPMADLVFAIARRLHQVTPGRASTELICTFLSSDHALLIEPGTSATVVEGLLQPIRKEHGLRSRGAFLRPVAERVLERYRDRTKRVCVVSDGAVYDYDDIEPDRFSSRTWFTFKVGDLDSRRVAICRVQAELSDAVLDEQFAIPRDVFCTVAVSLGETFPLDWEPANGVLKRDGRNKLQLEFVVPNESSFRARLRLPGWAQPSQIVLRGAMVRRGDLTDFNLLDYAVPGRIEPLVPPREGRLTEPEFDCWKRFEMSDWKCPKCGGTQPHLIHLPRMALRPRPIFDSLHGAAGGYFLLEARRLEWIYVTTGLDLGELVLVILEGRPFWTTANGSLQPVPAQQEHYRLEYGGRRLFLVPA